VQSLVVDWVLAFLGLNAYKAINHFIWRLVQSGLTRFVLLVVLFKRGMTIDE